MYEILLINPRGKYLSQISEILIKKTSDILLLEKIYFQWSGRFVCLRQRFFLYQKSLKTLYKSLHRSIHQSISHTFTLAFWAPTQPPKGLGVLTAPAQWPLPLPNDRERERGERRFFVPKWVHFFSTLVLHKNEDSFFPFHWSEN